MALWMPYAEEALDLSRTTVKQENQSPSPINLSDNRSGFKQYKPTVIINYSCNAPLVSPEGTTTPNPKFVASPSQSPELYDLETLSEDVEYLAFERAALRAMAEKNGGTLLGNNPRMRRAVQTSQAADDSYRKQREKNNFAAKQSRDRRKLREVRLAFQVTFLQNKVAALRSQLAERFCTRCQQQCQC